MSYTKHESDGWYVYSESGKRLGGPYSSESRAKKRLAQVHYFKTKGKKSHVDDALTLFMMEKDALKFPGKRLIGRGGKRLKDFLTTTDRPPRHPMRPGYQYMAEGGGDIPPNLRKIFNPNVLTPGSTTSNALRYGVLPVATGTAVAGGPIAVSELLSQNAENREQQELLARPMDREPVSDVASTTTSTDNIPNDSGWLNQPQDWAGGLKPWQMGGIGLGTIATALLLRKLLGPKEPTDEELLKRMSLSGM